MSENKIERRVTVRGIVADENGHVFAVKHTDRNTGGESEFWALPGGGLEIGESLTDGLAREFEEELGIKPEIGRLLFVQQFVYTHRTGNRTEKMEFFFDVTNASDFKGEVDFTKTSHGHELARVAFIDPSTSDLLPDFLQTTNLRKFIDTNQPVMFVDNLGKNSR